MSRAAEVNAAVHAAYGLLQTGRVDDAVAACRRLVAQHPKEPWPAALLGHLLRRRGELDSARALLETARKLDPRIAQPACDLALIASARGEHEAAVALANRACELGPKDPNVYFAQGQVLLAAGRDDAGERAFAQAEKLAPGFGAARYELGVEAFGAARWDVAARHFRAVVQQQPQRLNAWVNLGLALLQRGEHAAAYAALERAGALAPDDPTIALHQAQVLEAGRADADEVAAAWLHAAERAPADLARQLHAASLASIAHRYADVRRCCERVLAVDPRHLLARWVRLQTPEFEAHKSAQARAAFLAEWRAGMAQIEHDLADVERVRADAPALLDSLTNFYVSYFGEPLVEEQRLYARCVRRLVEAAGLTQYETARRRIERGRRRVGVVSPYLHRHSVTKVLGPMLRALPAADFELHAFYTGAQPDAETERWRARADAWADGAATLAEWAQRLHAADLDVLVFPDLGMHPQQHALAALRLAPVQVACWGHPATTGCATIDWFVSPDLMEPADADAHYAERLFRLPRLGTWFQDPQLPPAVPRGDGPPVFVCAQHAAKLHPAHDALFARLLAACPTLEIELYTGAAEPVVAELGARMRAAGLPVGGRLRIEGLLPATEFAQRLTRADALLDTLDFSGGITSLEALSQGLPIVTVPGACMRGRQTAGMLAHLGVPELIAPDVDAYVALAARLATDGTWRAELAGRIAAARGRLFEDRGVAEAFAAFLRDVTPAA